MTGADNGDIKQTAEWMSQAKRLLAYGGLDGVIQRPLLDGRGRVFPHFAVSANGCRFVDSLGRTFIDWVNGWGPVLLGYKHSVVEKAITAQLECGPTLSLMNPVEIRVAKLLEEMVPCAEMIAFGKNGSDSVTAAIRIARAVTKRDIVLQFGFHGFHDWYTCLHPQVEGIPQVHKEYVDSFEYNDLNGLKNLFEKYRDRVAAVIMEPVNMWMPDEGYLEGVRELTHRNGSLLIFDEMVTAFRLAPGGAQEYFDVTPDLACLGKGMANGMPLSAVVGSRIYMQRLPACGFGMTFRGETISLSAAEATLSFVRDHPVAEHLSRVGGKLRDGFEKLCRELNVQCQLSGPNARMTFVFHDEPGLSWQDARAFFLQECLLLGVMTNGNLLPSYAHDDESVEQTLAVFESALAILSGFKTRACEDSVAVTGGSMNEIRAIHADGFVEVLKSDSNQLDIAGWLLLKSGNANSIQFVSGVSDRVVQAKPIQREDLAQAFPNHREAEWAGFEVQLPANDFSTEGYYRFTIDASIDGQSAFRCLVNCQSEVEYVGPWSIADGVLYL